MLGFGDQPVRTPRRVVARRVGATVHDVSVRDADAPTIASFRETWAEFGLLVFPAQHLTRSEQDSFARCFGEFEFTATALTNITSDGTLRAESDDLSKSLKGNEGWHHDSTFMPVRATGAVFTAEIIPSCGGDTGFAVMRSAYDAFDEGTRTSIAGLAAYHSRRYGMERAGLHVATPPPKRPSTTRSPDRLRTMDGSLEATVSALEAVVDDCIDHDSRCGYFAAIYLMVTRTIQRRSAQGSFEDNERMETFVVAFASHYLVAHEAWRDRRQTTGSWALAFEAADRRSPLILQHVLLGMNAHINLDLGVATAALAREAGDLASLEHDFTAINDVLASLIARCEDAVVSVSPWLKLGSRASGTLGERMVSISLVGARHQAWHLAERLVALDHDVYEAALAHADRTTTAVGRAMLHPGPWSRSIGWVIRLGERTSPRKVTEMLRETLATD